MKLRLTLAAALMMICTGSVFASDDEIRGYFTGPAHLPWHRMQNIDKWQGSLPVSWIGGPDRKGYFHVSVGSNYQKRVADIVRKY